MVDFGWTQLKGFPAWFLWSTAHLYFLVGFRNRFMVGLTWLWNYLTFERGARLITGIDQGTEAPVLSDLPVKTAHKDVTKRAA